MSANSTLDSNGLTKALVERCRGLTAAGIPDDASIAARQCLLDWLGVTLAGAREPLTAILREEALAEGGHPRATLVGSGERVSLQQAALINGAASHALDFDDVQMAMIGHPTVPVLPALLALGEEANATVGDVLTSFIVGVEMECRLGLAVMPGHYATGFHATGTLGTFGAAAGCAHFLGLNREQWLAAMGIAGAQAAGLKSMFGTMCKPFHAGKAAANGMLAAQLARRGFTSNPAVMETPQGFAATQTPAFHPELALADDMPLAVCSVLFKYHAACYGTHETIEGVLRLKHAHGFRASQVRQIRLRVPVANLTMCNIEAPATALEGKFSMRFTAALAAARDDTSEAAFTDSSVREGDLVDLRQRVVVEGASVPDGTEVTIALVDGRELHERVNLNIPETDLDRQWERLRRKFLSLATPVVGSAQAAELLARIENLDPATPVRGLIQLSVPQLVGAR